VKFRHQHELFEVSKTVALAVGKLVLVHHSIGGLEGFWQATVVEIGVAGRVVVSYAPDTEEHIRSHTVVHQSDIVGVVINDGTIRW
jgi:hypothetical protein